MEGSERLEELNQMLADKIGIDLDKLPKSDKEKHAEAIDDMSWPTNGS